MFRQHGDVPSPTNLVIKPDPDSYPSAASSIIEPVVVRFKPEPPLLPITDEKQLVEQNRFVIGFGSNSMSANLPCAITGSLPGKLPAVVNEQLVKIEVTQDGENCSN